MATPFLDHVARGLANPNQSAPGGISRVHEAVWQAIDARIQEHLDQRTPQVWTVGSMNGGLPTLDPDGAGQGAVPVPRMAGFRVQAGDRVMTMRTRSGARVVVGKIITGAGAQEAVVGSSEIIAGSVGSSHLASAAVRSSHIGSGQVLDGHIVNMSSSKLAGQIASNQIASVGASQVTGQISDNQIAGISASKIIGGIQANLIQGQITDAQISGMSASKLIGNIDLANTTGTLSANRLPNLQAMNGAIQLASQASGSLGWGHIDISGGGFCNAVKAC